MRQKRRNHPEIDGMPTQGIYYYVWLKPRWDLWVELGDQASHLIVWNEKLSPEVARHYKIRKGDLKKDLARLQHAMPRGRVVEQDGKWIIAHGNDFPTGLSAKSEIKTITSAFGLSRQAILGNVRGAFHSHETMDEKHQEELQKIIGKVPY